MTDGGAEQRRAFICAVLEDLEVLEKLLREGRIESAWRIGAEQEYVLLDSALNPAPVGPELVQLLADDRFTTELGRFNVEANLTPRPLGKGSFEAMAAELRGLTDRIERAAVNLGARPVLVGSLPHFELGHVSRSFMTPSPRYAELDRAAMSALGGRMTVALRGMDSLIAQQDSIMPEALGTSFQVHLQVPGGVLPSAYNWSVAIAAPLVAAAGNSALIGGRRLWQETRIALMELCADIRGRAALRRGGRSRTSLGPGWMRQSPLELYQADLSTFDSALCGAPVASFAQLERGEVPTLAALALFNGSIWPWLRVCYGVSGGRPHLRIENRLLPSGPTLADEISNAALWVGLVLALQLEAADPSQELPFELAEANLHAAGQDGLGATLTWLRGRRVTAAELLKRQLLPRAVEGLQRAGLDTAEATALLAPVVARIETGQTGARWMTRMFSSLPPRWSRRRRARWTMARWLEEARTGAPVHAWSAAVGNPAQLEGAQTPAVTWAREEPVVIRSDAPVSLARAVARWSGVSWVAVEAQDGRYLGALSAERLGREVDGDGAVLELPYTELPELGVNATVADALVAFADGGYSAAAIVEDESLVGLIFEEDLLEALSNGQAPELARPPDTEEALLPSSE